MRKRNVAKWMVALFVVLVPAVAAAEVPVSFTHEGRLLQEDGTPVSGSVRLTFSIYDQKEGGSVLWQGESTVQVGENGFYSTTLGSEDNPIEASVLEEGRRWLGVKVDTRSEMTPRLPLESVPYATLAGKAEDVGEGAVDSDAISDDFSLSADKIEALDWGQITGKPPSLVDGDDDTLGGMSCDSGATAVSDGSDWACGTPKVTWEDIENIPDDLADGDDDTQYGAGNGVSLSDDNKFSVDESTVKSMAKSAMGSKSNDNSYHHDRYTDSEARGAVGMSLNSWASDIGFAEASTNNEGSIDSGNYQGPFLVVGGKNGITGNKLCSRIGMEAVGKMWNDLGGNRYWTTTNSDCEDTNNTTEWYFDCLVMCAASP